MRIRRQVEGIEQQGAIQHGCVNNERLARERPLTPPPFHLLTRSPTAPARPAQQQRRAARRALRRGLVGLPRVQRGEAGVLGGKEVTGVRV
jgi:hypothetical protein